MRTLFLLVLFTTTSVAQDVDPDLAKQVFALIADYQANQEKIYQSNFAFVGRTMGAHGDGKSRGVGDRWYLCVYESRERRLDAFSQVVDNNLGRYIENWQQHLLYDGKTLFRPSIRRSITVQSDDPDWEEQTNNKEHLAVPQPIRSALWTSMGYTSWTSSMERSGGELLASDQATLIRVEQINDGDIKATYKLEANIPVEFEITFGQSQDYYPVENLTTFTLGGRQKIYQRTEFQWSKRNEVSYPSVVHVTRYPLGTKSKIRKLIIAFDWKFGAEVSASIDPEIEDWREPFESLFGVDWQSRADQPRAFGQ